MWQVYSALPAQWWVVLVIYNADIPNGAAFGPRWSVITMIWPLVRPNRTTQIFILHFSILFLPYSMQFILNMHRIVSECVNLNENSR